MPDQFIAIHARTVGAGTYQFTTHLDHATTQLLDTYWFSADIGLNVLVSSWLHPDTESPSLDDPTNLMITRETAFTLPKAVGLSERRPQCLPIPATHHTLTFQLRQTGGISGVDAFSEYHFR